MGGSPTSEIIIQECGIGLVQLKRNERLSFAAPPLIRSGSVDDTYLAQVASVLGISSDEIVAAEWVDNGPGWVGVLLEDHQAVLSLKRISVDMTATVTSISELSVHTLLTRNRL